jgi:hypothetical protein
MSTAAYQVRRNPAVQVLGRAGMVCYGVVHVLLAWLSIQVVFGNSGEQTDQKGAVAALADNPVGPFLLWVLGLGLFAFAFWQAVLAAVGYQWITKESKRLGKRIGAGSRAVASVAIGGLALKYALGSGSSSGSNQQQQEWTARLMSVPGGKILVGAVAIGILAVAVAIVHKGVTKSFEEDLNMIELPPKTKRLVERLGQVGWTAKGVAYGIIGILVGLAAIKSDPKQSGGLDKALHTLASQPFGVFLLALVALGFLSFGVYCFAAARAHRG